MERGATQNDAAQVAEVITAAQRTWTEWAGQSFSPYSLVDLVKTWSARIANPEVVTQVWDVSGYIRGVVSFEPERASFEPSNMSPTAAHLSTLFVYPFLQGSGVAQALHDSAMRAAELLDYTTIRLWVPAGAGRARSFYERNNWVPSGHRVEFAGLLRLEYRRPLLLSAEPPL